MRVLSVVGARPQFVKLAPVAHALQEDGHRHLIVHTGQHYDPGMSQVFFDELEIPDADVNLDVGSGPHGRQTARMLSGLEEVMVVERPDWVLTYGDTNSTVAAALAAVKLQLPLAHLEAGLRSFNRRMPEEHNRVLTDHASDLLLAPSRAAVHNLTREGLADRAVHVGDVMVDVALLVRARNRQDPPALAASPPFVLATIHRQENTDDADRLEAIVRGLAEISVPVVLPAHPRLVKKTGEFGISLDRGEIRVVEPFTYREIIATVEAATTVVTDSGGLQKEAFVLGTPCVTVRDETEWVETLENGWNTLATDLSRLPGLATRAAPNSPRDKPYGEGAAARAVVAALAA